VNCATNRGEYQTRQAYSEQLEHASTEVEATLSGLSQQKQGSGALQALPRQHLHDDFLSLRLPSSTRRNQYDAAGAICCVRRHNDVTRCDDIDMPPYGPLLCTRDVIRKPEEHNIAMLIDEGRDTAIQAPDFIADCIPDTGETRKSYHTCHCTYNAMGTVCW